MMKIMILNKNFTQINLSVIKIVVFLLLSAVLGSCDISLNKKIYTSTLNSIDTREVRLYSYDNAGSTSLYAISRDTTKSETEKRIALRLTSCSVEQARWLFALPPDAVVESKSPLSEPDIVLEALPELDCSQKKTWNMSESMVAYDAFGGQDFYLKFNKAPGSKEYEGYLILNQKCFELVDVVGIKDYPGRAIDTEKPSDLNSGNSVVVGCGKSHREKPKIDTSQFKWVIYYTMDETGTGHTLLASESSDGNSVQFILPFWRFEGITATDLLNDWSNEANTKLVEARKLLTKHFGISAQTDLFPSLLDEIAQDKTLPLGYTIRQLLAELPELDLCLSAGCPSLREHKTKSGEIIPTSNLNAVIELDPAGHEFLTWIINEKHKYTFSSASHELIPALGLNIQTSTLSFSKLARDLQKSYQKNMVTKTDLVVPRLLTGRANECIVYIKKSALIMENMRREIQKCTKALVPATNLVIMLQESIELDGPFNFDDADYNKFDRIILRGNDTGTVELGSSLIFCNENRRYPGCPTAIGGSEVSPLIIVNGKKIEINNLKISVGLQKLYQNTTGIQIRAGSRISLYKVVLTSFKTGVDVNSSELWLYNTSINAKSRALYAANSKVAAYLDNEARKKDLAFTIDPSQETGIAALYLVNSELALSNEIVIGRPGIVASGTTLLGDLLYIQSPSAYISRDKSGVIVGGAKNNFLISRLSIDNYSTGFDVRSGDNPSSTNVLNISVICASRLNKISTTNVQGIKSKVDANNVPIIETQECPL